MSLWKYLSNPSAQTTLDQRFVERLNAEIYFIQIGRHANTKEPNILPIARERIVGFVPSPEVMWNANSLVLEMNSSHRVHFLWWYPLHHERNNVEAKYIYTLIWMCYSKHKNQQ